MSEIEIEIDGKPLKAKPNSMVIQVADEAGIYIPRFCYHKHLSVAANCRMCLVEVEKSPKTLPACATPVMPGMKVFTRSPKALAAQKAVMEFLLINHPLDCPICDQGGECELQDLSMGYGQVDSYYVEGKRVVKDENIGPLIATDMTRCIQCTRCVRFGDEIAGFRELGAINRGEHMEISTYVGKSLQSDVSGNIIDLCPVGALTSKPFRFTARPWELSQYPTIAPHDCIGSNIYAHTRGGKVMRVVPRENKHINETWISDRDRFSYEALYHADRLAKPMIKVDDQWRETDWQTALEFAVIGLQKVLANNHPEQLGALISPNSTLEEFYLLQKLMRQLGSSNIDHRLRQVDFSDQENMPVFPGLNLAIDQLEECDVIVLIGSNIQKEQPMAALRVRKAARKNAHIIAINMLDYQCHFKLAAKKIVAPQLFVPALAEVAFASDVAITELLQQGKKVAVLLGAQAFNHPEAAEIRSLANLIAQKYNGTLGFLTEGANAAGAWLAGAIPHRAAGAKKLPQAGLNAESMLSNPRKAYILTNVEPDFDCANSDAAFNALEKAEFVVSLSIFNNPLLAQYADVMLPMAAFTETSGTFVNAAGIWQKFQGIASAFEESRPAWKIFRVLGNLLHCEGFDFNSPEEVHHEMETIVQQMTNVPAAFSEPKEKSVYEVFENKLFRIGEIPIYAVDSLVRRARALQETQTVIEGNLVAVRLHPEMIAELQLKKDTTVTVKQRGKRIRLPFIADPRVPKRAAYIAGGILATVGLGELFGPVEIVKGN